MCAEVLTMMQQTIDKLVSMKLSGMRDALEEQMNNPAYDKLTFDERFSMLVDKEMTFRENRKLSMLMRKARFRHTDACVEEVDFRAPRGIRKEDILRMSQNEWIRKHYNLIITGPTGVGNYVKFLLM